jgi:hypothetical protein
MSSPNDRDQFTEDDAVQLMENLLRTRTTSYYIISSFSQKRLFRTGDLAAVALRKLVDEDSLRDPEKIPIFAKIVAESFAYPEFIVRSEDREPKATIALLEHFLLYVQNASAKSFIEETLTQLKAKPSI